MSRSSETARLLHWTKPGRVPGEVRREIIDAELKYNILRMPPGTMRLTAGAPLPSELGAFKIAREGSPRGVELVAREILHEFRAEKSRGARVSALRWRAYALLTWCSQEGELPPPILMRLIFECLDLHEGQPPKQVCERFKWPNLKAGFEAYERVVEVDARRICDTGKEEAQTTLSRQTHVDPKTIGAWRETNEYRRRRKRLVLGLRLQQRASKE